MRKLKKQNSDSWKRSNFEDLEKNCYKIEKILKKNISALRNQILFPLILKINPFLNEWKIKSGGFMWPNEIKNGLLKILRFTWEN